MPGRAQQTSPEQRLRRGSRTGSVTTMWRAGLPSLVASQGQRDLRLVLDPTPQNATARIVMVAWRARPGARPWAQTLAEVVRGLVAEVAAALPPDRTGTLIGG